MIDPEYKYNETLIKDDLVEATSIYVELGYLKYLDLGKLISHPDMSAGIYTGMVKTVASDEFSARQTSDVRVIFNEASGVLNNEHTPNSDIIAYVSPEFAGAAESILNFLGECRGSQVISGKRNRLHVTIDTSRLQNLTLKTTHMLIDCYTEILGVEVSINRVGLSENPLAFDAYFLEDLAKFNNTHIGLLDARKFENKYVFCTKTLPLAQLPLLINNADLTKATFEQIEAVMAVASRFKFVGPFPCMQE